MKTDLFQSCGHCWVFPICWCIECSTFTTSSFRIWNSSTGIVLPPLALFIVMLPKAHLTSIPGCLALGWWSHHDYLGHFEGGHHLHYLHHCLASVQITGKEHSPAHQQKIGLKIYWVWPHPSEQDLVSPSVSLSSQEVSISLLSFSIRGQTDWKPQSQKTNQSDLMDHSLV